VGQFNHDIEVIAGSNKDEGILYFIAQLQDPTQWEYWPLIFNTTGPKLLFNIADESEITDKYIENAHKLLDYYVGSVDNINEEHKEGMFKMFTDAGYLFGIHNAIRYLLKHGATVYQYLLTYQGEYSSVNGFGIPTSGVAHADDLFYIFGPVFGYDVPLKVRHWRD
jgi:carboxylesterase type B